MAPSGRGQPPLLPVTIPDMRRVSLSLPPSLPDPSFPDRRRRDRRRRDPVPIGELVGLTLPRRVRRGILDLGFLKTLWEQAAPGGIAGKAVPVRFENGVLTIFASDPGTRAAAHRRRLEIARNLVRAAGLPDARLRVRVELGDPAASRPEGAES